MRQSCRGLQIAEQWRMENLSQGFCEEGDSRARRCPRHERLQMTRLPPAAI
jgi:hypothetical protein